MTYSQGSTALPQSIAERFAVFHQHSPEVYSTLVALARQWVRSTGRKRLGIATLFERTRWELAVSTSDPDFKLNNSYRAYYARLIMAREPDLANLFETRKSEADNWIVPAPRTEGQLCVLCSHLWAQHVYLSDQNIYRCDHASGCGCLSRDQA